MTKARLRYFHIGVEVLKRWSNPWVFVIQLESRRFRRAQGESVEIWWRPEAVLSAIHSCDVRLVVKSQSGLQIASSIRIMPQHSYIFVVTAVKH